MDMRRNEFVMRPADDADPYLIPFEIGEEIEIKGYKFRIEHIDIGKKPTLMVLSPVAPRKDVKEFADLLAKAAPR